MRKIRTYFSHQPSDQRDLVPVIQDVGPVQDEDRSFYPHGDRRRHSDAKQLGLRSAQERRPSSSRKQPSVQVNRDLLDTQNPPGKPVHQRQDPGSGAAHRLIQVRLDCVRDPVQASYCRRRPASLSSYSAWVMTY